MGGKSNVGMKVHGRGMKGIQVEEEEEEEPIEGQVGTEGRRGQAAKRPT